MADIVYLYPKSSCNTENCNKKFEEGKGYPSSRAVRGCNEPDFYRCYDSAILGYNGVPQNREGIKTLNPQVYDDKISPYFDRVGCTQKPVDGQWSYLSLDPRLFDAPRAIYLPLDRPPMNGDVRLKNIYSKNLTDYGQNVNTYSEIKDGQITYYVDKSISAPFYKPVYSEHATDEAVLYKDPMGAIKPEYNRIPLINTENPTVEIRDNFPYCLSYIQDTQSFREDIIALQQRKHNQEKWTARWDQFYNI